MPRKNKYGQNNILNMNPKGNMYPNTSTFDNRKSYISSSAVNPNVHPMFYIGNRVNILGSNNPKAFAVMKYGNVLGTMYPSNTLNNSVLSLTVDINGNYKLINDQGKSYKVYNDSSNGGNYVNMNKQKMYI